MTPMQRALLVAGAAGSLVAGGAIGATLAGPLAATASSGNTSGQNTSASTGNAYGFLVAASAAPKAGTSNENATHEGTESAAREAAENNGTATFGGGTRTPGGNENATHEAGESAAREAQENAPGTAPAPAAPTTPTPAPSLQ